MSNTWLEEHLWFDVEDSESAKVSQSLSTRAERSEQSEKLSDWEVAEQEMGTETEYVEDDKMF